MKNLWTLFNYKPDLLLMVFVFFLPLVHPISQGAIVLYFIFWLFNRKYTELPSLKKDWFVLGAGVYVLLHLISGIYSSNLLVWGADLEPKLYLLFISIIVSTQKNRSEKEVFAIIWAFIGGCFVMLVYLFYGYYFLDLGIYRGIISSHTSMNSIYFAMYLVFILIFGLYFLFKQKIKLSLKTVFLVIFLVLIHYFIYAIAQRMAILSLFAVEVVAIFIWKIILKRQWLQAIIGLFAILVIHTFSLNLAQRAKARLGQSFGDPRVHIWQTVSNQAPKSPVIGFGSGDVVDVMVEGYQEINFERGIKSRYNCHNQYFEMLIATGIIGLICFVAWLSMSMWRGWRNENYLFCLFLAIVLLNFLTESMLERQQGTFFIALFGALLFSLKVQPQKQV